MNLQHCTRKVGMTVFIILLLLGASMVLSDLYAPFTTNAYLQKYVVSITTEVKGNVERIFVHNGDFVKEGDPLFSIDKHDIVEDRGVAYANMVIIQQHLSRLRVEISQTEEKIEQQKESLNNKKRHFLRYKTLSKKHTISTEQLDDARLEYLEARKDLQDSQLELESKQIELGKDGGNGGLLLAQALLDRSDSKIAKTTTYAPVSGLVTNMQLNVGEAINSSRPQVAITSGKHTRLIANFNEKALGKLDGANVLVVFDALPGQIFEGKVTSKDSAVQFALHADADIGKEAYIQRDDRWIRKSQQVRSVIEIDNLPAELVSGSKATAMIKPKNHGFWRTFSSTIMTFISWFHFIY
ncbi:efflux RND transporter periplasmic adaptor subunit [Vibrio sp. AND4]|uniref:HlyD family secretion protein n=1 Tax=Vibrio sp. AND4 TaxID=314289 RepID=UPI00015F3110|nr:efflux RND transporter periplasmic adaptor subunit [Vibrio sp. AND4]EDP60739.1 putative secretion protein [Vibrio sp. AND4]